MYEYDIFEVLIKDFEEFKSNEVETDLQKLIDTYIMTLYYVILDYTEGDDKETPDVVIDRIEREIKEYYKEKEAV